MSQNSNPKTILLVEDEALIAMGKKLILEKNGYSVIHVLNGEKALETVAEENIDLILMDIDLGKNRMDGTVAAEIILKDHDIPIIFHTSHAEKEMVEKVKGITRYGYVLKNAGEFVLLESIQMAFELFNAHQQIAEKEERYQYMFDYNRSSVAVLQAVDNGKDFIFVDYNQTAEAVDAIWKEEVLGKRVTEVFPGVEAFGILDVFREVWETGEAKTHTDAYYQDERISGWRESYVYRIPSGEIVSVYRDVTEEKETEDKLQVASHELECLYQISRLVETEGETLPAILQGTVDLLPRYIGDVGNMSVRLTVHGNQYASSNFRSSMRERTLPVFVHGEEAGILEIYCNKHNIECIKEEFLDGFDVFLKTLIERTGKIIERFEGTEALQRSERRHRDLVESIQEGIWSIDKNNYTTYVNPRMAEMLGYRTDEMIGKHLLDFIESDARKEAERQLSRRQSGKTDQHEFTFRKKDGTEVRTLVGAAPRVREEGQYTGALAVVMDITHLKKVENELQERRENYRYILESIGDGVISTDIKGNITRTNHIARELIGCAEADLQGKPLYDAFTLYNSVDGKPVPNPVETVIATDEIITLSNHTKLVSKWGTEIQIADSVAPVHDGKGETQGAVLVFRDETEKYEQEKKLRESEEQYRRLFENMAEGFVRANTRGEIVLVNQAAADLCGYDSVDDLTGRPITDLYVDPSTRSELLRSLEKEKHLRNREFLLKKKNGETIWTLCNIKMVPDENGDFFGTEAIFRDYTDKKVVELERERHERFLDSILNAIQEPVSVHDCDLNIKKANKIVHAMYSDRGPLEGEKCYTAYYGRSTPCEECPTLKAFETKQVHSCMKEISGEGGGNHYFELFAYPIIDAEGAVESVVEYARDITELKKNEEGLVRTKEQLDKMLQILPEGFVMVNVEGEITYANEAAGKILEIYKDKITGSYYNDRKWKQIDERGDPYPLEELPLAVTLRDKREVRNLVHGIVAPDGETKWLSVNSAPLLDGNRKLSGAIASFRDISERKNEEELLQKALAESEELKRVVNNSPVCVFTWRNEKGWPVEYVSENVKNLLGYNAEDFISGGIAYRKLIHTDDLARIEEEVRHNLTSGRRKFNQEYRLIHKDGSVLFVEDRTFVESDEEGSPDTIHGLVWDISEQKNAENSLRIQQEYEKAIAAASRALLTVQSEREAIQKALTELRDVTAVSRLYIFENFYDSADGLCMRTTYEVCAPGVGPEIDNPVLQHVVYKNGFSRWREVLSSGNAICGNVKDFPQEEREILEPQGIVTILVIPMFVNGEWKGFIGFDEIDREYLWRRSEALLLQTASDLIGGYLGRMESEKIIQRQLQEKELLIRETHHRIKNNIASIHSLLHLHAEQIENEEARSIVNEAVSRVNSMKDLYEKMLSSDDVRVVSAAPYINDLIDSIMPLFSHQADVTVYKRITDFTLDSDTLFLLGIIVNEVVTNAMKYAFPGRETGTIRVYCKKTEDRVSLIIQDDGIGLPEGFDAEQNGGLGTSLVTMLGEQIGGTVTFESENGTKVTLEFTV